MRVFAHRLALHLGRVDVDRMLSELTAAQLQEWIAYSRVEPFGELRADLRAGIIAATQANCHRSKRSQAFKPEDFMPEFAQRKPERMSSKAIASTLRQFATAHNAIVKARQGLAHG